MDLIGKKVKHNKYVEGMITKQDDSYVSVKFMTETDLKKFSYPSCFKKFLKLLDGDVAAETDETVKRHEEQKSSRLWKNQKFVALCRKCRGIVQSLIEL